MRSALKPDHNSPQLTQPIERTPYRNANRIRTVIIVVLLASSAFLAVRSLLSHSSGTTPGAPAALTPNPDSRVRY